LTNYKKSLILNFRVKITVYTTTDCQFSKAEKEYLTSHSLMFEEKNLETNKDFLTEMMAVSNNFAGTPVTRVEKDDGTIAVLKGFTREEFDAALGLKAASPTTTPEPPKVEETKPVEPAAVPPVVAPPVQETPAVPTVESPIQPTPTNSTSSTPPVDEKLGSVLDKLEEKTEAPQTPTETPPTAPPADAPVIPDFSAGTATQPVK
jgi:glutaredoxin